MKVVLAGFIRKWISTNTVKKSMVFTAFAEQRKLKLDNAYGIRALSLFK